MSAVAQLKRVLLAVTLACRPMPEGVGVATSGGSPPALHWRIAEPKLVWRKAFPRSGREGVCSHRWVSDPDGSIYLVGRFLPNGSGVLK
jgi:hypothetical protein